MPARSLTVACAVLIIAGAAVTRSPAAHAAAVFTVDSTGDGSDAAPGDGACATAGGDCTLRAAIQETNAGNGGDTIAFHVLLSLLPTIAPTTPLPEVTVPVIIDGTTQPGLGWVELSGAAGGGGAVGLAVLGGVSTVRGLVINRFSTGILIAGPGGDTLERDIIGTNLRGDGGLGGTFGIQVQAGGNRIGGTAPEAGVVVAGCAAGIYLEGEDASGNVIEGDTIGVNGTTPLPNGNGIQLYRTGSNTIGGTAAGSGNVISGSSNIGVWVFGANGTTIQGNLIGTDPSGTVAVPNLIGIELSYLDAQDDASNTLIGGSQAGAGNVISGNSMAGIDDTTTGATAIQGNLIGTDVTGTVGLGGQTGIDLTDGSANATVGGLGRRQGNVISGNGWPSRVRAAIHVEGDQDTIMGNAIGLDRSGTRVVGNGGPGVDIAAGSEVTVRANSIFASRGLGIDLGADGVSANDPGDGDTGPNGLQNYPVLESAASNGPATTVNGTLNSTPTTTFTVDVYWTNPCDASAFGEGRRHLGSFQATTDANGDVAFSQSLPASSANGGFLTATATDPNGNTSEFSRCRNVSHQGPDFNGDGRSDLAVGVPNEDVGTVADAGAVNVLYGAAAGLSSGGNQFWTEDSTDVPDAAETGDHFGQAVAWGDLNGDGYDDLAVGVPGESVGTKDGAGAVVVLYGSASGLSATGSQLWTQDTGGVRDRAQSGDGFGSALAVADLGGDGFADLSVGIPGETVKGAAGAGAMAILYGGPRGLSSKGNAFLWENWPAAPPAGDAFASALAAGDQNGDGLPDLGVGAPLADGPLEPDAGSAFVYPGSVNGLDPTNATARSGAHAGDQFGTALAFGDFNHDGYSDLAVGAPFADVGRATDAGAVIVLNGKASGFGSKQVWSQASAGILDRAEAGDHFGAALAAGDFDGTGAADLAIGVPGEDVGTAVDAGAVNVINNGVPDGNQFWTQDSTGILDHSEAGDAFGSSLAAGAFNADPFADLAVGVPGEDLGTPSVIDCGAVAVVYGTPSSLAAAGNQLWSQGANGILDQRETGDGFGSALE